MTYRISATISDDLGRRLDDYRKIRSVNVSAIIEKALEKELETLVEKAERNRNVAIIKNSGMKNSESCYRMGYEKGLSDVENINKAIMDKVIQCTCNQKDAFSYVKDMYPLFYSGEPISGDKANSYATGWMDGVLHVLKSLKIVKPQKSEQKDLDSFPSDAHFGL